MDYYAVLYFFSVWVVSALAGCFRCIRNGDFKSIGHTVSVSGVSGFLGFGVVSLFVGNLDAADFNGPYWLGVASIIGLAGKEQTTLIQIMWKSVIEKFVPSEVVK